MTATWQIPNIHSPTGSVDSGVGLSPRSMCFAYDDASPCSQIFGGATCPKSPTCENSTSTATSYYYHTQSSDYSPSFPKQLTPDELECLAVVNGESDYSSCFSPASTVDGSAINDFEIDQFDLSLTDEEAKYSSNTANAVCNLTPTPYDKKAVGSVKASTIRRKRRLKARQTNLLETHPGVALCLIPKSGTSKPRQSRNKHKPGNVTSVAGSQGMHTKKPPYVGARVKQTAREKLLEFRKQDAEQKLRAVTAARQPQSSIAARTEASVTHVHCDRDVSMRELAGTSYPVGSAFKIADPGMTMESTPNIRHSIVQIISSVPQTTTSQGSQQREDFQMARQDNLCRILGAPKSVCGIHPELLQYVQQLKTSASHSGQTPFHIIVNKLNQKMGQYSAEKMHEFTAQLCQMIPESINATNYNGETPLYQAALYGNLGVIKALMEANANPWIQENSGGEMALHAAVRSKNPDVVRIIVQKVKGEAATLERINTAACDGNTALHKATALRNVDQMKQKQIVVDLLEAGMDPSHKNHINEMAHSLLPPSLKELQDHMKKMNSRKRALASHHQHAHSQQELYSVPPFAGSQSYNSHFQGYPTNAIFQHHSHHPQIPFNQQHQLGYRPGPPGHILGSYTTAPHFRPPVCHPNNPIPPFNIPVTSPIPLTTDYTGFQAMPVNSLQTMSSVSSDLSEIDDLLSWST